MQSNSTPASRPRLLAVVVECSEEENLRRLITNFNEAAVSYRLSADVGSLGTWRIDAHLLNRKGVARLCYCDSVLHTLPAGDWAAGERGIACLPDRIDEFRDGALAVVNLGEEPARMLDRGLTPEELAAVRKAVGRDVEDAHHLRLVEAHGRFARGRDLDREGRGALRLRRNLPLPRGLHPRPRRLPLSPPSQSASTAPCSSTSGSSCWTSRASIGTSPTVTTCSRQRSPTAMDRARSRRSATAGSWR